MEGLPSGTVTFLFTDIEGSTALLKRFGDRYEELLTEHRRIVRDTFARTNGIEIDTQGDAFFFAFARARDAVEAAVDAQREHAATTWPDGASVRVRMGLHTGEPALGSEGYLGLDVVRAARICTAAKGGDVLLSETTRLLVGSSLPDGVTIARLGQRHLKDFDQPEEVFELAIDGLPVEAHTPEASAAAQPDLHDSMKQAIQQKIEREILASFGADESGDDAEVDEIAGRTADLGDRIRARVDAALRAKGIKPD
jgi:class 3 adenylate cyclase